MNFSHRFFLYGPFAMLVLLAVGISFYWWIAANALAQRLDALNGHELAPGVRMHFATKRIAGFPFRLDAILTDFSLETARAQGPISWHAESLAAHRLTYASDVIVFEAAGPQVIRWTGESGAARRFEFTPGTLRASAVLRADHLDRFDLDIVSLSAQRLAIGRAQFHLRQDPVVDALDLVLDLQAIRFASDTRAGFPAGLSHVRLESRAAPQAPFASLLAGQGKWPQTLEAWRSKNGFLNVDRAAIFWQGCAATSSGNLALDAEHRPAGALSFSIGNCRDLAKQARGVSAVNGAHRPVLLVLAALAAAEPVDSNGALPATLVFRDGLIFLGPGKSLGANSVFVPIGFLHAVY